MVKIVIASDSFKGTLSSNDIINIAKEESKKFRNIKLVGIPIADGGEGTLESISSFAKGKFINVNSKNPLLKKIETKYYIDNKKNAYIEVASSDGLNLVSKRDPSITSSYGVGLEIKDAIKNGAKNIIIGLGGSATNDGGAGLLSALDVKFLDKNNKSFIPVGGTLKNIRKIDTKKFDELVKGINFTILSDVKNPLLGEMGATYVFSKQKGATPKMMKILEANMSYYSKIVKCSLNRDFSNSNGAGAAGGIGYGLMSFANAKMVSGIDYILDNSKFDQAIKDADYVITGEGRLDLQSLNGKVISGIIKRTKKYNVPTIALVGGVDEKAEGTNDLVAIFTTTRDAKKYEEVKKNSKSNYRNSIRNIFKLLASK